MCIFHKEKTNVCKCGRDFELYVWVFADVFRCVVCDTGGLGAVNKVMQRGQTAEQTQAAKLVLELVSCEENRLIVKVVQPLTLLFVALVLVETSFLETYSQSVSLSFCFSFD